MMWHVGRENAVLLAGPAAVLLQLAHPAVAAGVARHSRFQSDPIGRFRRTFRIVDGIIFGAVDEALAAAAAAHHIHAQVRGRLDEAVGPFRAGMRYSANRPDLLLWVHATLVQQSLAAYQCFVAPLHAQQREAYYAETKGLGQLFGIPAAAIPATLGAFEAYFEKQVAETLAVGSGGDRLRRVLFGGLPTTWAIAPASFLLAGGLLPPRVRELFGLPWNRAMQLAFRQLARVSRRAVRHLPDRARFGREYLRARRRTRWLSAA